ncbi:hypothetical protein [Streptomyces sp. 7N604]|uniref:hypothetical protein n=1 Tax=Streptomyces sp. 7N604 TaxID=3457415 RepID=UPI003FD5439D
MTFWSNLLLAVTVGVSTGAVLGWVLRQLSRETALTVLTTASSLGTLVASVSRPLSDVLTLAAVTVLYALMWRHFSHQTRRNPTPKA